MEEGSHERRLDELGREAFERAVKLASERATQNIARIHRVRLVTHAAVAAFVVALAVALVVSLVIKGIVARDNRSNAFSNCHLIAQLSRPLADFVGSDAELRARELKLAVEDQKLTGAYRQLFGPSEFAKVLREAQSTDRAITSYWQTSVIPRLDRVADADCAARIR